MGRKMRKVLIFAMLIVLNLLPGNLLAVKFDRWETGMDIKEIVGVAKRYGIPIARTGIVHGYLKFEQRLLDDQFYQPSRYGRGGA
jgi:hypothetical protein